MLQEVIANLEADSGTYEKKTLLYRMRTNEKLMKKILHRADDLTKLQLRDRVIVKRPALVAAEGSPDRSNP